MTRPETAPRSSPAGRIAFAVVLAVTSVACSWSVPADPGLNAKRRSRTPSSTDAGPSARATSSAPRPPAAGDAEAGSIYYTKCSQCHEAFSPKHATASQWPAFVRKYGPRAGLFGPERDRVLAWLKARAR